MTEGQVQLSFKKRNLLISHQRRRTRRRRRKSGVRNSKQRVSSGLGADEGCQSTSVSASSGGRDTEQHRGLDSLSAFSRCCSIVIKKEFPGPFIHLRSTFVFEWSRMKTNKKKEKLNCPVCAFMCQFFSILFYYFLFNMISILLSHRVYG